MGVQKIKPTGLYPGRLLEQSSASLIESVKVSINAARVQVGRSLQIVAQSQDLIARTRLSLDRASDIRRGFANSTYNPVIDILTRNE